MTTRTVNPPLLMSGRTQAWRRAMDLAGRGLLFSITAVAAISVFFIFWFIARDALPFFRERGFGEFLTGTSWYPANTPPQFGAAAIFVGSLLVTAGAILVAAPLGISAAVALSDVLSFNLRQVVKPVIEILAAIPSVAYGFFALVVLAPLLQERGGPVLCTAWCLVAAPLLALASLVAGDALARRLAPGRPAVRASAVLLLLAASLALVALAGLGLWHLRISSGTNALNAAVILGIMALPTVVSVSEDALQAVRGDLREGSYALGATRSETMLRVVIPAAGSGILAALLLGVMRALGETMVVWMASGNAARIPEPWYDLLQPVRTLTATIAGDMGEADHVTGSARYGVLFAMGLSLLVVSFLCNLASEWVVTRQRRRLKGG